MGYHLLSCGDGHDYSGDFNAFQGERCTSVPWILSGFLPISPSPHDRPITFKSQFKVDVADFRPPHRLVFSSYGFFYFRTDRKAKEKHRCCLIPSLSVSFSLFQLENTGCSLHPRYKRQKKSLIFIVYLSTLVCWINHFTPVINKRTNGWMSLPSDY